MRPLALLSRYSPRRMISVVAGVLLAGCTAFGNQSSSPTPSLLDKLLAKPPPENGPAVAEKDSCGTPAQCKTALKKMVNDPKRGWVGQPQPAVAYTNGTRLFAYRALRTRLSCGELRLALGEVRAASKSLASDVPGVSPEQLTRTRALNSQVETELSKERGARCTKS